jgi:hypothetical protein
MKNFLIIILISVCLLGYFGNVASAEITATEKALQGLDSTADSAGVKSAETDPAKVVGKVIEILLSVLGAIFLVIVIYGGIMWMTSAGAPESVTKAQNMIIDGSIGLIVCLGAYALTYYIVSALTTATGTV